MLKSKLLMPSVAALSLAAVWGAGAAQADTVMLNQTVSDTSTILNVFGENDADRLYDDVRINVQGENQYVYAGAFQVTEEGTDNNWLAFCVDLFNGYQMPAEFDVNDALFGSETVARLDKLFTNFFDTLTTDREAASFQVAIWEIVSDNNLDLLGGDFILRDRWINRRIRTQTEEFLTGLDDLTGGGYDLTFLENSDVQNLVIANPVSVPLPAGGVLLLTGLGALSITRRRRNKAS